MTAKTLKDLRKEKGLTIGRLAEISGVSAKTISQYEKNPPSRPSRKALAKIGNALGISPGELEEKIYSAGAGSAAGTWGQAEQELLTLEDRHVERLIRLIDKEIEELRYILLDTAELADDHPPLGRFMAMVGEDIDLLMDIKTRFLA